MKKLLIFFQITLCALIISACSNPTSRKDEPPAPKPDTYIGTIAVAAKKADFYVRLAFDLADGYLSDKSVVRKFGKDKDYVETLDFPAEGDTTGLVGSSRISKPLFKYWYYDEYSVEQIITYSELYKLPTRALKRDKVIATATGTAQPSHKFDITFRQTDTTNAKNDTPEFTVHFSTPGQLIKYGANIDKPSGFDIWVKNSSGVYKQFTCRVNNVSGRNKVIVESDKPKPADEFMLNSGNITVTGTDTDAHPNITYTITLAYSNDTVENKTGNFTGSDGFSANYTLNKDGSYYTIGSDLVRKYYAYWDYPL